jgi:cupin superfamily acireductone dioxygenase involved in methionine salvage
METEPDFLKPSNKFKTNVLVKLTANQEVQLRKFLNLHYLGDEDVNHVVNGQIVAKYPEKETEEYRNASYNAVKPNLLHLSVEFDVTGKPTFTIVQ